MRRTRAGSMALAAGLLMATAAAGQDSYYQWRGVSNQNPQMRQQQAREQQMREQQMRQQQMRQQEQMRQQQNQDRTQARQRMSDPYWQEDRYQDRNPYGVGPDIQDDKWDTGFWDMGEYDTPQNRNDYLNERAFGEREGGWMAADRDDRNPFGVGDDVFDDKWDTGLGDMGEYNAWDYPQEYQRDLQMLRQGRFLQQYGITDRGQRRGEGLRDDDVWSGEQPWYRDASGIGFTDRTDRRQRNDLWDSSDYSERTARNQGRFGSDRVRVPLGTAEDARGMDRQGRLRLGDATENPYGVGEDVFDDKWDTGGWDMGEYNAWHYPQDYRRDLERHRTGQFEREFGVTRDREGLRDDDVWSGEQPWYRDAEDRVNRGIDNRTRREW